MSQETSERPRRDARGVGRNAGETLETVESDDAVVSVIRWHLRSREGVGVEVVESWVSWIHLGAGGCTVDWSVAQGSGGLVR
jgi:hypothetical protein